MSSLTMCSGQGVVIQEKGNEKECVVEDIGDISSQQRATRSRPYIRRDTSRRLGELRSPGEPGGSSGSSPHSGSGAIDIALLRGDEGVPPILSGRLGLVLRGEELVQPPGAELGIWVCHPLEDWPL